MEHVFGVEMKQPKEEKSPGYYARLVKKTAEICHIIDRDNQMVIVATKQEQNDLAAFYQNKNLLEETFDLTYIENGEKKQTFEDYGFMSNTGHAYLYTSLICGYKVMSPPSSDRDMGLLQMEEHLIAVETEQKEQTIYYIDANFKPLIEKIAVAYQIKLEWTLC